MLTGDSDLLLHIIYGRAIIDSGIPATDPMLHNIEAPLVLQEWLFEAVMALLDRAFGLAAVRRRPFNRNHLFLYISTHAQKWSRHLAGLHY